MRSDLPARTACGLAILPRLTHYDIFAWPLFASVTLDFLHALRS